MREGERKARKFAKHLRKRMTSAEVLLWSRLRRDQNLKFRRQHPIGPYIADFACVSGRLVVEIDGATHSTAEQIAHDDERTLFMKAEGWNVIRIWNQDIYRRLGEVLDFIAAQTSPLRPSSFASKRRMPPPP